MGGGGGSYFGFSGQAIAAIATSGNALKMRHKVLQFAPNSFSCAKNNLTVDFVLLTWLT
jgi:hypothetical protein